MMRIENNKKNKEQVDYDPYAPLASKTVYGAGFREHRKSQDQIVTRKSHSIFTSNNDFIALNKNKNDDLDNLKQIIKSSSVFDMPTEQKSPSQQQDADAVSLPSLHEDTRSRRMS